MFRIRYPFKRRTPGISLRNVITMCLILVFAAFTAGCSQEESLNSSGQDKATDKRAETTGPETERTREPATALADGAEARTGDGAKAGDAEAGDGEARAGDAFAGNGEARAGGIVAGDAAEAHATGGSQTGKTRLRFGGTPGAAFSGTCTAGGEERKIEGRVPERFVFDLNGQKLDCVVRLRGSGSLEVVLTEKGVRAAQRISSTRGTLNITHSSSGVSVVVE